MGNSKSKLLAAVERGDEGAVKTLLAGATSDLLKGRASTPAPWHGPVQGYTPMAGITALIRMDTEYDTIRYGKNGRY